jgi:hypothetical protein
MPIRFYSSLRYLMAITSFLLMQNIFFAKQVNATTVSINTSHAALVSQPDETAQLILDATKGSK